MESPHHIGHPVYVPQSRRELPRLVEAVVDAFRDEVVAAMETFLEDPGPAPFLAVEEAVLGAFRHMAAHVLGGIVAFLHKGRTWVDYVVDRARERIGVRTRHRGWRRTPVVFLGGVRMILRTPYLSRDLRGRRGRRRGVGRRGRGGGGFYPVLEALGIRHQATPALASEVAREAVRTASFEEAYQALCERGIPLDEKAVRRITLWVGQEALDQRRARIEAATAGSPFTQEFAGRRIVLSTDGGRLRLREGGKRGRKGPKGRRKYRTPWKEPKLVTAYVIDETGGRDRRVPVLYDATLGNADAAFEILVAELRLRGAAKAKEIILTADGARWIWNRADDLARALGLAPDRIVKVADYYHAVQHLWDVAELCASKTPRQREAWVRRMKKHLNEGRVDAVVEAIRALCRGRNARKIRTEAEYFESRRELMRYDTFRERGIPCGSGAVESAIRRVVNLRLKGASIFWRDENAERMLHLRCYLKAGRWQELMQRVIYCAPDATQAHAA